MVRVRGDVSASQLTDALARIAPRHPALFRGMEPGAPLPLEIRAGCGPDDWIAVAQDGLRLDFPGFPAHGPFAHFTCLQTATGFDLVLACHHGVADGISGVYILRDLLRALSDPQAHFEPLQALPHADAFIPPALKTNAGLRRRVNIIAAILAARVQLEKLRRRFMPARPIGPAPSQPQPGGGLPPNEQYLILPTRLDAPHTAALLARCKKEGVTVHAAVCAAWLRAFTAASGARFGSVSTPVNLRPRISPAPGETASVLLSTVETRLDCAPARAFWDMARDFKHRLGQNTRDEELFFKPMLISQAFSQSAPADVGILLGLLFFSPVNYDFSITNLGIVDLPERCGALQVEAFNGPLVNSSEHERTVGVSTFRGQLGMTFNLRRSKMEPAQAKALLERVSAILVEASA